MAAVLDAMAPYVKQLIADMAKEEVNMLLGVSGEIKKMEDNMESLKCFFADAERRRITEQTVHRWVRKLKDAMYDATDILDLCQLEAAKRKESTGGSMEEKHPGCFQSMLLCLRNPVFAHKIGNRIKGLNQRLDDIYKEAQKFKFIDLGSYPERRMPINAQLSSSQKMTSEFVESAIVGEKIEKDTRELAQLLITSGNHDIRVVSIVGTGGMGKTTLAQKIFKEITIQEHFKVKIWLSITHHFNEVELLRTAIEHAGGVHGGVQDKTLLTRTLTNTLSTGKFLLVLDDMWGDQAWSHVLSIPVRNASQKQPGNWVLITTRLGDLAQRLGASFYQHQVSPLNEDDAWSLLNKQLPPPPSPSQVVGTDHLKDVGMKIIRKCGGLPLAIKVMGGLLSTRYQSESEWEAVLNHHAWSVVGLPKELDSRLLLSYDDLCPQLKQCFLYCSLFPEGTSIEWTFVIHMWISEGFIQPRDGHDDQLEEVANEDYDELIKRNLIEPTEDYSCCTMHDVVRSFAKFMAREESLVLQDEQVASSSKERLVRRLSVASTKHVPEWANLQRQVLLRTLIIDSKMKFNPGDSLTSFSSLRVLFISVANCDHLIESLCQLVHLRYLRLYETNVSKLPDGIHSMKFLQHIVLLNCMNLENLPSSITKLTHLRTLAIDGSDDNVVIPKGFGGLTNLRSLSAFPAHMNMDGDCWCSLEEIAPLSQLRFLRLHGLENVPASSWAEKATISSKGRLKYLELICRSSSSNNESTGPRDEDIEMQQQKLLAVEEVFEKLCPPTSIEDLRMEGYSGRWLPNWMMARATPAFKSLRYLELTDIPCCTKLPDGLCRLPSLESLEIVDAPAIKSIGPEFQASSSSSLAAFPNLAHLTLVSLHEWEEWDWEEQAEDITTAAAGTMAMPALRTLTIRNCKLRCLPPGLANSKRHTLRELFLSRLRNLTSVDNFPSVVDLVVQHCPELKSISGLSRLHKIKIVLCPNMEVLEGVPSLDSIDLRDNTMDALPGYLQAVNPRYLELTCSKKLYESLLPGSSEWNKISHIGKRNIIAI